MVVSDGLDVVSIVQGKQVEVLVLNSSAGLTEEVLGFGEVGQCDGGPTHMIVDDASVAEGKGVEDVGDDLGAAE